MKRYLYFPDATPITWAIDPLVIVYTPNSTTNDTRTVNLSPISNATTYLWEQIEPNPATDYATITPNNTTKNIVVTMPIGVNVIKYRVVLNGNRDDYKYVDILDFWSCSAGVCVPNTTGGYTSQAQCNSYLLPPPFTGGQCIDVQYIVQVKAISKADITQYAVRSSAFLAAYSSFGDFRTTPYSNAEMLTINPPIRVNGPISGAITLVDDGTTVAAMLGTTPLTLSATDRNPYGPGNVLMPNTIPSIYSVIRSDGLTDNCGNPLNSICPLPPKWKSVNGICSIDSAGNYNSSIECQAALIPPQFAGGQCVATSPDGWYTLTLQGSFIINGAPIMGHIITTDAAFANYIRGPIQAITFTPSTHPFNDPSRGQTTIVSITDSLGTRSIADYGIQIMGSSSTTGQQLGNVSATFTKNDGSTDNCGSLPSTSPKWKCVSGVCINDSTGTYNSQTECQASRTILRYNVFLEGTAVTNTCVFVSPYREPRGTTQVPSGVVVTQGAVAINCGGIAYYQYSANGANTSSGWVATPTIAYEPVYGCS